MNRLQLIDVIQMAGIPTTASQIVEDKIKHGFTEKAAIVKTVEFLQDIVIGYNINPNKSRKQEMIELLTNYYKEYKERGNEYEQ